MKKAFFLIAGVATLTATAALADHHAGKRGWDQPMTRADVQARTAEHFAKVDTDGDGFVTEAEADAAHAAMKTRMQARMREHRASMFELADTDRNGALSQAEWDAWHDDRMARHRARAEARGVDTETLAERQAKRALRHETMFAKLDSDADGQLSEAELKAMHAARASHRGKHAERRAERRERRFVTADANGDGRVTLAEAQAPVLARFDRADTDGDGIVTPEERRSAHQAMRDARRAMRNN